MIDPDSVEFIELGEIVGAWGVKGWVRVRSYTARPQDILDHPVWFVGDEKTGRRLLAGRFQGRTIMAQLGGLNDREEARTCVGKAVRVPVSDLPRLPKGEYYWAQLEGLNAVNPVGFPLGVVHHLFATGANDVLVIKLGERETLVPFVPKVVRRVDLERGYIELDWEPDA